MELKDKQLNVKSVEKKQTISNLKDVKNVILKNGIEGIKNTILNFDCLEIMKEIPDKSIDLVLTDPPYGITKEKWDTVPKKKYFDEIFRISKNQIICGGNYFKLPLSRGWICWDKVYKKVGFLSSREVDEFELFWTSFNKKSKILRYTFVGNMSGWNGKIRTDYRKGSGKVHPTQKPVELMMWCIENYSQEGDTILDPFLGSGTTAVACQNLKRNFIGIEISKEYCKIARERLRQKPLL